jgi:hypothetical protein
LERRNGAPGQIRRSTFLDYFRLWERFILRAMPSLLCVALPVLKAEVRQQVSPKSGTEVSLWRRPKFAQALVGDVLPLCFGFGIVS